jgi:mono/diheme cytochrome c family protein
MAVLNSACAVLAPPTTETGTLAWYYQETPGDQWDYTAVQQMTLTDLTIGGRLRKVLMQAPQYVSVMVGWGGATGLYVGNPTHQFKAPGRLYTFVLDGKAKLEPVRGIQKNPLSVIEHPSTPADVDYGAALFARRCSMCHGVAAVSAGAIVDLRYALPSTYDALDQIVRGGAYQQLGMPKFYFFKESDVAAIRSYLLSRRKELTDAAAH